MRVRPIIYALAFVLVAIVGYWLAGTAVVPREAGVSDPVDEAGSSGNPAILA